MSARSIAARARRRRELNRRAGDITEASSRPLSKPTGVDIEREARLDAERKAAAAAKRERRRARNLRLRNQEPACPTP